jgi:pimeloyl-ACP methyl ester carboxylesterase
MNQTGYVRAPDGAKIWYGTTGRGPDLVLCDGLACDGFIWPYLMDRLADRYRLIRWHYRGHGESDPPSNPDSYDIHEIAGDLRRVLDHLDADRPVIVGHSMGVQVLLQFALDHPTVPRGLINICGSFGRPLDTLKDTDAAHRILPYLERLIAMAPGAAQTLWETVLPTRLTNLVATATETNPSMMGARDMLPYLEHVAKMDLQVFLKLVRNAAEHTTLEALPGIDVPTLIVAGRRDTVTPLHRSEQMHELMPHSELLVIDDATHVAPLEAPVEIGEAVEEFCEKVFEADRD